MLSKDILRIDHNECEKDKDKDKGAGGLKLQNLTKSRTIMLTGVINDKSSKDVCEQLLFLEGEDADAPITIFMDSGGGSVSSGYAIYDTIRFIKPEVRIVCAGLTASIATVILIAAPKQHRYTLPNTKLLIHQPLIPAQVFGPASDLEITAREIMKTRDKINLLLSTECGQPLERVTRDTERDYWMDAEQALEYGLVTKIITSRDEIDG